MTSDALLNFELFRLRGIVVTVGSLVAAIVIMLIGWLVSTGMRWAPSSPSASR
jgi:hypothetical protein